MEGEFSLSYSKSKNTLFELIKYASVGTLNVLIDFLILEILMVTTGIYKGFYLAVFNAISFIVYSINGYILNKKFTFKSEKSSYFKYASILFCTMLLNSFILSTLTLYNLLGVKPLIWASLVKIFASMTTGLLNFIINKFFVFRKKDSKENDI